MKKEYDFLFLEEGELPFLLGSLKGLLDEKGYKTAKSDIRMKTLGEIELLPEFFILNAATLNKNENSRVFLVDLCIQQNVKMIVIGDQLDIDKTLTPAMANVIVGSFARPLQNHEVAERLEDFIQAAREKKKQKRILVIDDSATFLRLISGWLEEDYVVNVCPSATAAFYMIEANRPDLILLDYEMPVCNGAQFLEMLHSESAFGEIPVIFLTSKDDKETVREVISLKPQGYLLKNQTKNAILQNIADFFAREKDN